MAGFMDSFAEGIDEGFTAAYRASLTEQAEKRRLDAQQKAQAERDLVLDARQTERDRVTSALTGFNARKTDWLENEEKALQYRTSAMNLVESMGGRVPAEAWTTVYRDLWSGRSIEDIRKDIENRGFVPIAEQPSPEAPVGSVTAQTNEVLGVTSTGSTDAVVAASEAPAAPTQVSGSSTADSGVSDALWGRQVRQESGGRQTDSTGAVLESNRGALGVSQSLVSTSMDPGFGAKSIFDLAKEAGIDVPAEDENTARALLSNRDLNERFGRNYMDALIRRYDGDEEKALIAYNAGASVADRFNGDRATLPQETQGYLSGILGAGGPANNNDPTQSSNWAALAEDRNLVVRQLGIEPAMYDRVMRGFMPDMPELTYAWGIDRTATTTPDWMKTDKIRRENYISFAAAAREAGNASRATFIETVGRSLEAPTEPPKFMDASNFSSRDHVEGYKLAAEHMLANASTDEQRRQAQVGIQLTTEWLRRTEGEKWYMQGELTVTNLPGKIHEATARGDMTALAYFNTFARSQQNVVPTNLTEGWVASRFAELSLRATAPGATDEDRTALNTFKESELPIFVTALRLNDRGNGATTLVQAYDDLARAKSGTDQAAITAAENRVRDLLNAEAARALSSRSGTPIQLIRFIPNEEGQPTGRFEQITGFVAPDPQSPGRPMYTDRDGNPVNGFVEHDETIDTQARQVVSTMTTQIGRYQDQRDNVVRGVRLFGDIANIVDEEPRVLTSAAGLTVSIDSVFKEVSVGLSILDDLMQRAPTNADGERVVTLNEVQAQLRSQGLLQPGQNLETLATTGIDSVQGLVQRKQIFEAKMILFAFRAGGLEGQSGQAMSNRDFDRLKEMIGTGRTPAAFMIGLQGYVQDSIDGVRTMYGRFGENADLRSFEQRHRYSPLNGEPGARGVDDVISGFRGNDARIDRGMTYLERTYSLAPTRNTPPAPVVTTPPATPPARVAMPVAEAIRMLGTNPSESMKQFFIDAYGADALPANLRGQQ